MKPTLLRTIDGLFTQGEDIIKGLKRYAGDLEVAHVNELMLRNTILTAEAAVRSYDESVAAKVLAVAAQTQADEQGKLFLRAARNVLAVWFGELYSPIWAPTGFPDNSTSVPNTITGRQALLRALQNYFANHSAHENAPLAVTSEQAGICFDALSEKRSAVNNAYDLMNTAKIARDAALDELRSQLRLCIDELCLLMADDDPRWYSFGFTPPAATESPETVESVVLTHAGPGQVLARWEGAPRAGRYRVLKQIVGVDAEPVPVETVYDTHFAFTDLIAGQRLRVQIEAANDVGFGEPSEAVEIMVT